MPGRKHSGYHDPDYRSYPGEPGRPQEFYPSDPPNGGYRNGDGRPSDSRYRRNNHPTEAVDSSGGHVYSVDHLVTWSVGVEHGVLTHQDGMRQLSKLEQESGIYTMRCTLTVKKIALQIADVHTGDLVEQFPLECIRDPVAVIDKNGSFKNLVLFTVLDQPGNKHSPSEMHIFQVIGQSARELANDMADAMLAYNSKSGRSSKGARPSTTPPRRTESYEAEDIDRVSRPKELRATKRLVENDADTEDDVKMGVALLNRCFDDVERFVLRLKQSSKALQELTNRKRHSKSRKHGDGMLTLRSKAPSPAEFVECFQKIKLAFNLLARLKSYLHSPNSADLVHFLFTPLSLLVEASNDPRFDINDLVRKVVTPLLNRQAIELLENCLTSKEYEFWLSLGEAWRTPRSKWTHGQLQEFRPRFSDGWQPAESWLDMFLGNTIANLAAKQAIDRRSREVEEEPAQHFNGASNGRNGLDSTDHRQGRRSSDHHRSPSQEFPSPPSDLPLYTSRSGRTERSPDAVPAGGSGSTPWDDYQRSYLRDLQQRNAKIYEVVQDRKGNNSKELTIRKGEIVEVLDDGRNWWKCANINGDQGFVPYTLLKQFENVVEGLLQSPSNDRFPSHRSSSNTGSPTTTPASLFIPAPPPPPPAYPPPPTNVTTRDTNWRLDKRPLSSGKADRQKKVEEDAASRKSDDFSLELRQRLSKINLSGNPSTQNAEARRLSASLSAQVFIDQHSSANEVADWLEKKGFQEHSRRVLAGYTGSELFLLSNDALTGEFGHQEGARLVSQVKLMKTTAGYTLSGSSQLRKIFEQRKQKAEHDEARNSQGSDNISDDSDEFPSVSMVRSNKQGGGGRRY